MSQLEPPFDYLVDPAAIERLSFETIRAETDLARFGSNSAMVASRLVHAAGEPAIAEALSAPEPAVTAGVEALTRDRPVLCDVEMVRWGLSRRHLNTEPLCFLDGDGVAERAGNEGITRTMAAVDDWLPRLDGGVAVIGNAPTALFRLLEHLHNGAPRPALIVGMPCGFVGAAESKEALAHFAVHYQQPAVFVAGRRGGSALAAAAVNAMARLSHGEGNAA
jgi:precorrin-8X/cobalt-precorrin-8 methylmutase